MAALDEPGFLETRVDLHEAGMWVTKPGAVGRLNTQIQSIEVNAKVLLGPDVAQSGDTVVIFDEVTITSFNASLLSSSPPWPSLPRLWWRWAVRWAWWLTWLGAGSSDVGRDGGAGSQRALCGGNRASGSG